MDNGILFFIIIKMIFSDIIPINIISEAKFQVNLFWQRWQI